MRSRSPGDKFMKLVPGQRLLWLAAAPVFLLLPGPQNSVAAPVIAAVALVTLLDALLHVWSRPSLSISAPTVIRSSRRREQIMTVTLRAENMRPLHCALAIHPTRPLHVRPEICEATLPADEPAASTSLLLTIRCNERGVFPLGEAEVATSSRLGLWRLCQRVIVSTEVRVYPDLRADRRRLSPLLVRQDSAGAHLRRFLGKGREFEKLRSYVPGDAMDSIHWKASAKRRGLVTKEFQVERTQQVYVVLDASRLSTLRPTADDDPVFERYLSAALTFGGVLQNAGDCFGLFCFSDRRELALPARTGAGHLAACQEALLKITPRAVHPDFQETFAHIAASVRRRSLFIFLTDLSDPVAADAFLEHSAMLTSRHVVLVLILMRPDFRPLFTAQKVKDDPEVYHRLATHIEWRRARELSSRLRRAGVDVAYSTSEDLSVTMVNHYFSIKQRQRL